MQLGEYSPTAGKVTGQARPGIDFQGYRKLAERFICPLQGRVREGAGFKRREKARLLGQRMGLPKGAKSLR